MKKNLLQISFILFLFSTTLQSQIPNADFENWANGDPVGWITLDIFGDAVTQSSDFHSGSSAAKLQIIDFQTIPAPPVLSISNVPVSENIGSLTGYLKFIPISDKQTFLVAVLFFQGSGVVGGGDYEIWETTSSYTQFVVPITTAPGSTPDNAHIQISVSDTSDAGGGIGSYALIDDLVFGGFVDVKEIANSNVPTSYDLVQNFPNPFNPSTKIEYSIPQESFVDLKVYNLIGQEVATLVNQYQKAGMYRADFNAEGMNSGIYIAKLNANGFTRSVKMTLLK